MCLYTKWLILPSGTCEFALMSVVLIHVRQQMPVRWFRKPLGKGQNALAAWTLHRFSQQLHWRPRPLQMAALPRYVHAAASCSHQDHQWNTTRPTKTGQAPPDFQVASACNERHPQTAHTRFQVTSHELCWRRSTDAKKAGFHGDIDGAIGKCVCVCVCVYACERACASAGVLIWKRKRTATIGSKGGWR